MDIHDILRTSENLTGLSSKSHFNSFAVVWKIGGFCRLDRAEPTNHVHFHNCWEGHIVLDGYGFLKDENGTHPLTPGSLLVTAPRIQHELLIQDGQSLSLLWFMFDIQPEETADREKGSESRMITRFLENHQAVNQNSTEVLSYLSFINEYTDRTGRTDSWIIRIVQEMLLFFLEKLSCSPAVDQKPENKPEKVFRKIHKLISSDMGRKYSVPELAEACGMSPRSLQYLFRRTLKITLTEYIAEIKANHAARALLRGVRVQHAGEIIGIPDPAQFSRFFKKFFGTPPVKYRQRSLEHLDFFSTTFEETGYRKFV